VRKTEVKWSLIYTSQIPGRLLFSATQYYYKTVAHVKSATICSHRTQWWYEYQCWALREVC